MISLPPPIPETTKLYIPEKLDVNKWFPEPEKYSLMGIELVVNKLLPDNFMAIVSGKKVQFIKFEKE